MNELLKKQMTECAILDKTTFNDGYGGFKYRWVEGGHFQAFCRFDSSIEAQIAEKQGVKSLYTVITPDTVVLQPRTVFRRLSDGKIFRTHSDGDDFNPPVGGTIRAKRVTAEEWEIPADEGGNNGNNG